MNKREKMVNLHLLTKRVERKLIGRRGFLRGAVALGLSASSALLLFQACGGGEATVAPTVAPTASGTAGTEAPTASPTATTEPTQEVRDGLIRRLPELAQLPVDMLEAYPVKTEGKSVIYVAIFGAHPQIKFYDQLPGRSLFLRSAFDCPVGSREACCIPRQGRRRRWSGPGKGTKSSSTCKPIRWCGRSSMVGTGTTTRY